MRKDTEFHPIRYQWDNNHTTWISLNCCGCFLYILHSETSHYFYYRLYFTSLVNVGVEYYLPPIIIRIWKEINQWRIFIHHKTLEGEREGWTHHVSNCIVSVTWYAFGRRADEAGCNLATIWWRGNIGSPTSNPFRDWPLNCFRSDMNGA